MKTTEIENTLQGFTLFERLNTEQISRLARYAVINEIPRKATFYSEEDTSKGMHILLSGKVKLYRVSEDGKEQTIFVFGPGEPFCLCSVFSDGVLPANLGALEDSSILVIPPAEYDKMIQEDPTILINMMRVMSRRLKEAMDMIDSLSLKQVPSRLASYFMSMEHEGRIDMDISYRELAKIIGITPEALSRTLKKMTATGLIEVDGTSITIIDRNGLAHCSEGVCT